MNAARVVAATGGSTNAALHLPAMASEAVSISICSTLPRSSNQRLTSPT
jgi:dihydroxyacid dehydratase/phosphogluconate dehydratase